MQDLRHDALAALIPAYALGAADADERAALEGHLGQCAVCRAALADYQALGADLLYTTAPAAAPARLTEDLRRRLAPPVAGPSAWQRWLARLRRPGFAVGLMALVLLVVTNAYWAGAHARAERGAAQLAALTQAPGIALHGRRRRYTARVCYTCRRATAEALLCVYDCPCCLQDRCTRPG